MIDGNITAIVQIRDEGQKNAIGERTHEWTDVVKLFGYLDFQSGQNTYNTYNAKVQETTHIFICDFRNYERLSGDWIWNPFTITNGIVESSVPGSEGQSVTSENGRMVVNGNIYDILLIDDPMGMHQHLEIYLKYVGSGLGV